MKLRLFKNKNINKIEFIGKEIQSLINSEFEKVNNEPDKDSPLNQLGLRNGLEIINEYIIVREFGLAFEHVLYMVYETGIKIDKSSSEIIIELSKKMNIPIDHIQEQLKK